MYRVITASSSISKPYAEVWIGEENFTATELDTITESVNEIISQIFSSSVPNPKNFKVDDWWKIHAYESKDSIFSNTQGMEAESRKLWDQFVQTYGEDPLCAAIVDGFISIDIPGYFVNVIFDDKFIADDNLRLTVQMPIIVGQNGETLYSEQSFSENVQRMNTFRDVLQKLSTGELKIYRGSNAAYNAGYKMFGQSPVEDDSHQGHMLNGPITEDDIFGYIYEHDWVREINETMDHILESNGIELADLRDPSVASSDIARLANEISEGIQGLVQETYGRKLPRSKVNTLQKKLDKILRTEWVPWEM